MKKNISAKVKYDSQQIEIQKIWKKNERLSNLVFFLFVSSIIAQLYGFFLQNWVWALGIITFVVALMIDTRVQFKKGKVIGYMDGGTDALTYMNKRLDEQNEELKKM